MAKRDINSVIQTLIWEENKGKADEAARSGLPLAMTTLGVPLERRDERRLVVDLTDIRVFRNLHTFAQLLIGEVMEQCGFGAADIMVRRKVDANLTPELVEIGIDWVVIYARLDAAESLPFYHKHFGYCMQVIFRTLQTKRWGGILFPEFFENPSSAEGQDPPALLFPFHLHEEQDGQYFLVEYNRSGRFLRITVEDATSSRLQLKHITHRVVDLNVRQSYIPNVHLIAEQIHQGMLRECRNSRTEYTEIPVHQPDLFEHLRRCGLPRLQILHFIWPTDDIQTLLLEAKDSPDRQSESLAMLVKEIQLIEDPLVLSCLAQGEVIEMVSGDFRVYFDVSRYGSSLNVSVDERRTVFSLDHYLTQMPVLNQESVARKRSLTNLRLFLIHHITAEVIGLLKAFQEAGCERLTTFFVKYSGLIPDTYLETLMSLPPESFSFYSLQKIESRCHLSGRFSFSSLFSPLTGLAKIEEAVFGGELDFIASMRLASGHLFLKEALDAREKGEQILLVEDGGYLAPLINRFSLEKKTVREVFDHFHISYTATAVNGDLLFSKWMEDLFLGSVEHTRNGYDYSLEVMQEYGKLKFPVASIAISRLKRGPEAKECAVSILNATENILHRLGALLSKRNVLIIGSSGAIGGFLKEALSNRLDSGHLFGVDIAVSAKRGRPITEARTLEELGQGTLSHIDMVIGVAGKSVLKAEHLEEMVLYGPKVFYFISGSTKTIEFADLESWLQSLREEANPRIRGREVTVAFSALRDMQTGILQGYRVNLSFKDDPQGNKTLYLLGELMPINFLYYGIPREIVDEVMAQLFTVSCGLVHRQRSLETLPSRVLAVDHDIDADANPFP